MRRARILRVAEDYAEGLLTDNYHEDRAETFASPLVKGFSEHGFVIDRDEVSQLLHLTDMNEEQSRPRQQKPGQSLHGPG